jgi:hypothetical protein
MRRGRSARSRSSRSCASRKQERRPAKYAGATGISDATFYIYGRLARGKKVLGSGLAVIDCKHLYGVAT